MEFSGEKVQYVGVHGSPGGIAPFSACPKHDTLPQDDLGEPASCCIIVGDERVFILNSNGDLLLHGSRR